MTSRSSLRNTPSNEGGRERESKRGPELHKASLPAYCHDASEYQLAGVTSGSLAVHENWPVVNDHRLHTQRHSGKTDSWRLGEMPARHQSIGFEIWAYSVSAF